MWSFVRKLGVRVGFDLILGAMTSGQTAIVKKPIEKIKQWNEHGLRLDNAIRYLESAGDYGRADTYVLRGPLVTIAEELETHAKGDQTHLTKLVRDFLEQAPTLFYDRKLKHKEGYQTWDHGLVDFFERIDELPLPQTRQVLREMAASETERALETIAAETEKNRRLLAFPEQMIAVEKDIAAAENDLSPRNPRPRKVPEAFLDLYTAAAKHPALVWLVKKFPEILEAPYGELVAVNQQLAALAAHVLPEAANDHSR